MPDRPVSPGSTHRTEGQVQINNTSHPTTRPGDRTRQGNDNDCTKPAGMSNPYPGHQQREDSAESAHGLRALTDEAYPVLSARGLARARAYPPFGVKRSSMRLRVQAQQIRSIWVAG